MNRDGYADVIVGAFLSTAGEGGAYLYLGSAAGLATTPAVSFAVSGSGGFGVSVASAGDLNGDGFGDLVVGASSTAGSAGSAYVYLGSATGPSNTPATTLAGAAASAFYGISAACAGDVNGDGYADLIVGAENETIAGTVGVGAPTSISEARLELRPLSRRP